MVMSYPKLTKEVLQLLEKFVVYLNDSVVCLEQSLEFFNRENKLKNGTALTFLLLVFHHVIKMNLYQEFKIHLLNREDFYVDREVFYDYFISQYDFGRKYR